MTSEGSRSGAETSLAAVNEFRYNLCGELSLEEPRAIGSRVLEDDEVAVVVPALDELHANVVRLVCHTHREGYYDSRLFGHGRTTGLSYPQLVG
ncbi:hypothetical protein QRT08_14685 [Halalkalicoccus sp. NIPERK01]|nr:hypothetical protein [Halalkalicoccus sp. NIPERK01]MDL5363213.1 hypothetical protein [Halalkalicoccus sp. NIPERK01]